MRLDKYLKLTRLIKRRTIAKEVCDNDRVLINGNAAKPAYNIKIGDIITIKIGNNTLKAKITKIIEKPKKEEINEMYEILNND